MPTGFEKLVADAKKNITEISPEDAAAKLQNAAAAIVDVREKDEWDEGHIKGAIHIPYYFLEQRLQKLDNTHPLAVTCASGQRSSLACSILQRHGFTQLFNVIGGTDAWIQAGLAFIT